MTEGVHALRRETRRATWVSLLMAVCIVAMSFGSASARGCSATEFSDWRAVSSNKPASSLMFGSTDQAAVNGVETTNLPTHTLSRLAKLSGPFQSFQASRVARDPNCGDWGGRDKVRHAAIFFAATLGMQLFIESTFDTTKTEAFLISAAIGTLVGVSREVYDWKFSDKDCFSEQDLLANTTGILSAGLVIMISN